MVWWGARKGRVFTSTYGASNDIESEGYRRLLINGCFWAVGLEDQIKPDLNVEIVGEYTPTPFGFKKFIKGRRPADYDLN